MTASLLEPGSSRAAALADDAALVAAVLQVEIAWVRAAGVLDADAVALVERAAGGVGADLPADEVEAAGNPVLPLVRALRSAVTAAGGGDPATAAAVHRGLTSQDVLDTALMLLAGACLDRTTEDLERAGDALAALADAHRAAPAAGRTLTQHAVPVSVGLRPAQWLVGVADARDRVRAVRTALPVQCGGAAGTLSLAARALDDPLRAAAALADGLGLVWPGLPWHTRRTPVLRVAGALAEVCAALGVVAGNVLLLGRPELGELSEAPVPGRGGSSTMPGKTNPVLSVLVRSAALQAPQLLAQLHLCAGSAVDERPPGDWHAEWPSFRRLLGLTTTAAAQSAELLEGLHVDAGVAADRAERASAVLLAEADGTGTVAGGLGLSEHFVQTALDRWSASRG